MPPEKQLNSFPFRCKPYAHQLACWNDSKDREYFGLLLDLGAGKSKVLIDTAAHLYLEGKIDGLVVIAPRGCYQDWKDNHVPTHMPAPVKYKLVEWRAGPSKQLMEDLRSIAKADVPDKTTTGRARLPMLHVLILNVESVIGKLPQKILTYFLDHHRALIAVDEATTIGNASAARTKIIVKLGPKAAYRRMLTGDLAPNSPLTIWAPCEFLQPGVLGHNSFYSFKATYATQITQRGAGGRQFQQVVGYRNLDQLTEIMKRFCFIVKKADCLDLPPKIYHTHSIEMAPKQAAAYKQMKEQAMVHLEAAFTQREQPASMNVEDYLSALSEGLIEELIEQQNEYCCGAANFDDPVCSIHGSRQDGMDLSKMSTANLVIVQLLRLHQIACGFLTTDDGIETGFDEPNPRLEDLLETLEQCQRGVIIWACYRFNIKQIADAIAKKFGPETVVTFFGDTTPDARRDAKKWFQDPNSPVRFMVANQSSGKYGMTLTAADTAYYYANTYDREARAQSEDRCHRIGQVYSVNYIDAVAKGTVDERILKILKGKEILSESLRPSNWRRLFEEAA